MPSFGASGSVSGRGGLNSGRSSQMCMHVDGVAEGTPVARGTGPNAGGRPSPRGGVANGAGPSVSGPFFNSQAQQSRKFWIIAGVTKDSSGVALGSCAVDLFDTGTDTKIASVISDASGNYSFSVEGNSQTKYAVAYQAGAPDVAGTTVNTLIAT